MIRVEYTTTFRRASYGYGEREIEIRNYRRYEDDVLTHAWVWSEQP
jgi:hypothetical protein